MRTAPALQLTVARFGQWRAGLVLLSLTAVVTSLAWSVTATVPAPVAIALPCVSVLIVGVLYRAERRRVPCLLHWDGQQWIWNPAGADSGTPQRGQVEVVIDLGRWMLLKLVPALGDVGVRQPGFWLPVQAAGLERHWHPLRCAVYSPTPAAAPLAAPNSPSHER